MPGLGKTQLAAKYAYQAYQERRYPFVFWISGTSLDKLNTGFSDLLELIGENRAGLDQSARCTAARVWLEDGESEAKRRWLLVIDNVNDETVSYTRDLLPRRNSNGGILITTRTKQAAQSLATLLANITRVLIFASMISITQ